MSANDGEFNRFDATPSNLCALVGQVAGGGVAGATTYVCVAIDTGQNLLLSPLTIMDDPTSAHGGTIMFAKQKLFSEQTWQRGFSALEEFKRREGHCRVPRYYLEGDYRLGQWV